MATKAWFFSIAHANDANFRAWGLDLSAAFAEVGLVQTADTGQIDWATVTRPAVNTSAGYEIWRYTDSSIFIKIFYGTGNGAATPRLQISVGTGSDGAGTLTGVVYPANTVSNTSGALSGSNPRQSFLVYKDGFLGFWWLRLSGFNGSSPWGFFSICKTTNSAGAPDNRGFTVYRMNGTSLTPAVTAVNIQTSIVSSENTTGAFVLVPLSITSSIIGVDTQCFVHWTALPLVLPNPYMTTVIGAEVPPFSTFSTTIVGTTARTYLALEAPYLDPNTPTYRLAMLWE